ncbi:uncharacterized protein F4817DRAFT_154791 [Daldinia loculata]|uniref:uncharacterized protein n=1 Tax=Daldinia loculata TaxID=103429 RepID=UPI0020C56E50|nr:uncharacterized protein F4817DRAFT_154791 [Daldinia loculata]KAI1646007.1 hypothetical protein F4817DRAFT_154791 [Daldinia loculata]
MFSIYSPLCSICLTLVCLAVPLAFLIRRSISRPQVHQCHDHQIVAASIKLSHATESPFDTAMDRTDPGIYTAKQIADFVLSLSELTDEETDNAQRLARNHGIMDNWSVQKGVQNFEEIYSFNCVLSIAHFYNVLPRLKDEEISNTYENCVRAINSLTYFLRTPWDKTSRLPGPVKLSKSERFKLDRVWDICVCLLGAIKARSGFQRRIRVGDIPIAHDIHYRRAAKFALDWTNRKGKGRICQKALKFLIREEIEPFVQPIRLIDALKYTEDIQDPNNRFSHQACIEDKCQFDTAPMYEEYHIPGCSRSCGKSKPPPNSEGDFIAISNRGMPAVSISNPKKWWVEAGDKTLVVSHVWRDGIWGTRDRGINKCVHDHLVKIAGENDCTSYWIDCATIPEDPTIRKKMIMRINQTFMQAHLVLCWDRGLATLDSDIETTLLSLIVSPWHRRAWTLLEANRGRQNKITFLQWTSEDGSYELFHLSRVLDDVFDQPHIPLWIRSTLVELLPYSDTPLPVDAAGLLLSGRHASRPGDSESIWGLLRPIEAIDRADQFDYDDPYMYAKKVDVAFISSNATRFKPYDGPGSWRPGKTNASSWVRTAYGGIKGEVITFNKDKKILVCKWWAKTQIENWKSINWESAGPEVKRLQHEKVDHFALICPILKGDPIEVPRGEWASPPVKGFFRTSIAMECNRAILITQGTGQKDDIWHWEGLVEMKEGHSLIFKPGENEVFKIGRT